ncbi:hypothetical protein [Enterobacter roggenkampii]|uniref:hypothetical protein n=1 Tax=Enterobacter roggenkampii TaxID=1812935 RepID=UPI001C7059F9|nr:hypothetical protein [Enterobacter roggenkampii]MBW9467659.1 hypothetical protein [Enterobacter roggenkampii]
MTNEYYQHTKYDASSFSLKHLNQKKAQSKYRKKNKKQSKQDLPPLEIIKHYSESKPLTFEESELIETMSGVLWKPRQRYIGFEFNREPLQWEALGFISSRHRTGWLEFQMLDNIHLNGNELGLDFELTPGE